MGYGLSAHGSYADSLRINKKNVLRHPKHGLLFTIKNYLKKSRYKRFLKWIVIDVIVTVTIMNMI